MSSPRNWAESLPYELNVRILRSVRDHPRTRSSILLVCRTWNQIMSSLRPQVMFLVDLGTQRTKSCTTFDPHSESVPLISFPSVIGEPHGVLRNEYYVSIDALSKRGLMTLFYRTSRDQPLLGAKSHLLLEKAHIHKGLTGKSTSPHDLYMQSCDRHLIALVDPTLRESDVQAFVQMIYQIYPQLVRIGTASPAPLVCQCESTALVLDLGARALSIDPVIQGETLWTPRCVLPGGTEAIMERYLTLIQPIVSLQSYFEKEIGREMLELHGFIPLDPLDPSLARHTVQYELPDGEMISLGSELYRCYEELLFDALPRAIAECLNACPQGAQAALCRNILITGGGAQIIGFSERLQKEVGDRMSLVCCVTALDSNAALRGLARCAQSALLSGAGSERLDRYVTWHEKCVV